tara:strand:+ start:7338 stop:7883 length:546 start_codon:yes stop_codon:yes gene_type:complete
MSCVKETDAVISTTGMISRELFYHQDRLGNFYMIGSMGLLSSFGLGLAKLHPLRKFFVLDGDGSALMSMGTMALIAAEKPKNFIHIVLDNESYESTGAQPTISSSVPIGAIAEASGYASTVSVKSCTELAIELERCLVKDGPHCILIKVGIDPIPNIPRITYSPNEIRDRFQSFLTESVDG